MKKILLLVTIVCLGLTSCEAILQEPGFQILSDADAAALVDPHPYEIREQNNDENGVFPTAAQMQNFRQQYAGGEGGARFNNLRSHVTGGCGVALRNRFNRRPTTTELLQCTALKWGLAQDQVFAQAVAESYWNMDQLGDFSSNPDHCIPFGYQPPCPTSFGIMQVKDWTIPGSHPIARDSTTANLDIYGFIIRANYEGVHPWWPCAPEGSEFFATKLWFSGDCGFGEDYARNVYDIRENRVWETQGFDNA